jgi:hypothetical protein
MFLTVHYWWRHSTEVIFPYNRNVELTPKANSVTFFLSGHTLYLRQILIRGAVGEKVDQHEQAGNF